MLFYKMFSLEIFSMSATVSHSRFPYFFYLQFLLFKIFIKKPKLSNILWYAPFSKILRSNQTLVVWNEKRWKRPFSGTPVSRRITVVRGVAVNLGNEVEVGGERCRFLICLSWICVWRSLARWARAWVKKERHELKKKRE